MFGSSVLRVDRLQQYVNTWFYFLCVVYIFLFKKNYLFIHSFIHSFYTRSWLWHSGSSLQHAAFLVAACRLLVAACQLLVVACRLLVEACGLLTWGMRASQLRHACRIQFPDQVSNLGPLHWKCRVLPTGPPVYIFLKKEL